MGLSEDLFSKTDSLHFEIVSPTNDKTWLYVTISPLKNRKNAFLGWVAIFEDITRRKESERELKNINQQLGKQLEENQMLEIQLREQVNRDVMTGVYNRGFLEETLQKEISAAERRKESLSVVMVDVDHFKVINDTYGHKTGDEVIIALGNLLQKKTRDSDFVSRFGGDEFVLLLRNIDRDAAFNRAESWRLACKQLSIASINFDLQVTISLGIAVYPIHGRTMDELLSEADRALYLAKQAGRDCIKTADSVDIS